VNKKQIIIIAGIGLICFALSFTVGLFTRQTKAKAEETNNQNKPQVVESLSENSDPTGPTGTDGAAQANTFQARQASLDRSLTVKQLKGLILEMRSKLNDFAIKEKMLAEKEGRIQMSMEELHKNTKEMEEIRIKLVAQLSAIKQNQIALDEKMIKIGTIEKANTKKTALLYDKMKSEPASESIINLTKSNQTDLAVKIIYYMNERTSAKLLAEITKNDPTLAAKLVEKLRWIEETKE